MTVPAPVGASSESAEHLVGRLLDLWAGPVAEPLAALDAFGALYTDPVTINGTELSLTELVAHAAATHAALERIGVHVLDVVDAPDRVVVAFEMTARHIGTWRSALGDVAATGLTVTVRTIDVLTITDGRISGIVVNSDEVGLLQQLGASLRTGPGGADGRR